MQLSQMNVAISAPEFLNWQCTTNSMSLQHFLEELLTWGWPVIHSIAWMCQQLIWLHSFLQHALLDIDIECLSQGGFSQNCPSCLLHFARNGMVLVFGSLGVSLCELHLCSQPRILMRRPVCTASMHCTSYTCILMRPVCTASMHCTAYTWAFSP